MISKFKYIVSLEVEAENIQDAEEHIKLFLEDFNIDLKHCPFKCKCNLLETEIEVGD